MKAVEHGKVGQIFARFDLNLGLALADATAEVGVIISKCWGASDIDPIDRLR